MKNYENYRNQKVYSWRMLILLAAFFFFQAIVAGATTVDFKIPAKGKEIKTETIGITEGSSPNNEYQVEASANMVTVTKAGVTVLSETFTGDANWGFSPDNDRFVIYYLYGSPQQQKVVLYDLKQSGANLWSFESAAASSYVAFSRNGKYLLFATLPSSNELLMRVVEAGTGIVVHEDRFFFGQQGNLEEKKFGGVTWGFSSDPLNRSFVYAWITAGSNPQMQWKLVNLASASLVRNEPAINTASSFWRFSADGEALGMVTQYGADQMMVRLFKTVDGTALYDTGTPFDLNTVVFRTMDFFYIAEINGTGYELAEVEDKNAPAWPDGSELTVDGTGHDSISVSWPGATDDRAVATYHLFLNGTESHTVQADTTSTTHTYTITGLTADTAYLLGLEAADAAGNRSGRLEASASTLALDTTPPVWPDTPSFSVTVPFGCPVGRVDLEWSAAQDDTGVAGYRIYKDDELLEEVAAYSWMDYTVTGLIPGQEYAFKIEAGDASGNWTQNGPSGLAMTEDTCPPQWPDGQELIVSNISATSVTLTWPLIQEDEGVSGYTIFRGFTPVGEVSAQTHTYKITELRWSTTYTFRIIPTDGAGNDGDFLVSNAVTTTERTDTYPPTWPSGSTVTADSNAAGLSLTWTPAQDTQGVALYQVLVNGIRMATVPGSQTSYQVTGLSQGREYTFAIQAADASGNWTSNGPWVQAVPVEDPGAPAVRPITELELAIEEYSTGMNENTNPVLSADGRYLVFSSSASDLVLGVSGGVRQIYRYDRDTGEMKLASKATGGTPGDGASILPAVTPDGRYVAFVSEATNLDPRDLAAVSDDPNNPLYWRNPNNDDVFVHDFETGKTEMVSINMLDTPGIGSSGSRLIYRPNISNDGRYVIFENSLFHEDYEKYPGSIWVRDRSMNRTEPVNITPSGQAIFRASTPAISGNGRYAAFVERVYPPDHVWVVDRRSGYMRRVSISSQGEEGNGRMDLYSPLAMSEDGLIIAFMSHSDNLVPDDTNETSDIFVHDLLAHETTRISVSKDGEQANGYSDAPDISADGRYVAFLSSANNLVACDTNREADAFVYDRWAGSVDLANITNKGEQFDVNVMLRSLSISADGQQISFHFFEETAEGGGGEGDYVYPMHLHQIFVHQQGQADIRPPCWPEPALSVQDNGGDSVAFQWESAFDNIGVTSYRVFQDDSLMAELTEMDLTYTFSGLNPSEPHTFSVQAGDAAGNWSSGISYSRPGFGLAEVMYALRILCGLEPDGKLPQIDINENGTFGMPEIMYMLQDGAEIR